MTKQILQDSISEVFMMTLTEANSHPDCRDLSDVEFLRQLQWENTTDRALRSSIEKGDLNAFWLELTKGVFGLGPRANRKKVHERRMRSAMSIPASPLGDLWRDLGSRLDIARQTELSHYTQKKTKNVDRKNGQLLTASVKIPRKLSNELSIWLESSGNHTSTVEDLLTLADVLRFVGHLLPAKLGIPLWRVLLLAASDWGSRTDSDSGTSTNQNAELAWVFGLFFRNVKGSEPLRNRGQIALQTTLEDHTDTDGTLRAQEMETLTTWLPPLVRAAEWGYAAEQPWWEADQQERFQNLMGRLTGCFAGDGHVAFHPLGNEPVLPLLLTGVRLAGGSKKEWPLKMLLDMAEAQPELLAAKPARKLSAKLKASRKRPTETATDAIVQQSDWARMACLRNHSGSDADVFALTHHQSLPRIDFSAFGQLVVQGTWDLQVRIDSKDIPLPEEWACVCWHSDSDGDYLELQHTIDENRRIERQVYLSRTDHFLVLADCISGAGETFIEYTSRVPLVNHAAVVRHPETREWILNVGPLQLRSFPLGLPEDIVQSTAGYWGHSANDTTHLELRQTSRGGLYAPLVFDWTPARRNSPADWRSLTVTEIGSVVKTDRAAGHRLRIGNQQLFIYRSLFPSGELRTVLGHHTGHETIIARFDKNGDVKPLLIVE